MPLSITKEEALSDENVFSAIESGIFTYEELNQLEGEEIIAITSQSSIDAIESGIYTKADLAKLDSLLIEELTNSSAVDAINSGIYSKENLLGNSYDKVLVLLTDETISAIEKGYYDGQDLVEKETEAIVALTSEEALCGLDEEVFSKQDLLSIGEYEKIIQISSADSRYAIRNNIFSKDELMELDSEKISTITSKETISSIEDYYYSKSEVLQLYDNDPEKLKLLVNKRTTDTLINGIYGNAELKELSAEEIRLVTQGSVINICQNSSLDFAEILELLKNKDTRQILERRDVSSAIKNGSIELNSKDEIFSLVEQVKKKNIDRSRDILDEMGSLRSSYGVEIEYFRDEGQPEPDLRPGWISKFDVSLVPNYKNDDATELVSPILRTKEDLQSIIDTCSDIAASGYSNSSAGLHVHVGILPGQLQDGERMQGSNFERIKQILTVYSSMESQGLSFPERNTGIRKLNDSGGDTVKNIVDAEYLEDLMEVTQPGFSRNSASVNLQSLMKYGTLEFRAHSGTVNPKDITSWVKAINNMVEIADDILEKQPDSKARPLTDDENLKVRKVLVELSKDNDNLPEIGMKRNYQEMLDQRALSSRNVQGKT